MAYSTKQAVAIYLSKRLSLDHKNFLNEADKGDLKSLCSTVLKASPRGSLLLTNEEALRWIAFADDFPSGSEACLQALNSLNDELAAKSALVGIGFELTEADTIVYSVIHPAVVALSKSDKQKLTHVLRWMDYVQAIEDLGDLFEKISLEKARFAPPMLKNKAKVEVNPAKDTAKATKADSVAKDASNGPKTSGDSEKKQKKDSDTKKKAKGDNQVTADEGMSEKGAAEKDTDVPVSLLNIRVGLIRKASKHPSADSLLVEEVDVGEGKPRQVVSGLAKYCNPDDLVNRLVVLITNVKPGKLRDVLSEGLVLCASNVDHTKVEPLLPPEGAKPGEQVTISGHDGKPEDVLNPKKKQLDKITPHLYTDEKGIATYKGIPLMTSAGPCVSSIPKGSIK